MRRITALFIAALLLAALLSGCGKPAAPAAAPEPTAAATPAPTAAPTAELTPEPTAASGASEDGTRSAVFRLDRDGYHEDLHFAVTWKDGRAEPRQRYAWQTLLRVEDSNRFVVSHMVNLYLLDFDTGTLEAFLPEVADGIRWADIQAAEETFDNKSRWATAPVMSPEGSLLLYQTDRTPGGVRLYDFRTGEDRLLLQGACTNEAVFSNGWVLLQERGLEPVLMAVKLETGEARMLLCLPGLPDTCSVTEDGRFLVAYSDQSTGKTNTYVLDPETATPFTPGDFVPVPGALGEAWPYLPEGARPLTEEEVAQWQAWFEEEWIRLMFLNSAYERPEDVDLYMLLREGTGLTENRFASFYRHPEEGSWLLAHLGAWSFIDDTLKFPREDVEALLQKYLGLGLEEVNRVGLDTLYYVPEADAWYKVRQSDSFRVIIRLLYGYVLEDEVCLFHRGGAWYKDDDPDRDTVRYNAQQGVFRTVLRREEGETRFVSNLLALTDGVEARYAPPVSAEPCPLDLSGDCGRDTFRLEPEAVDYGSFDAARASLEDIEGFTILLEEEHPDYGTLFYGEAGEMPYLFFVTSEGIRYRLHLPATSQGTLPALPDWSEGSKGWILDLADPRLEVEWLLNCDALTDLGNGELRRMGQARWTLYLPTMEEFVLFTPSPRTPLEGIELRYRDVAIGDTVERMYSLLGEPEECTEHRYTDPDPPQGLEYREYRYDGAVFREAYTEAEGWTGVIGQIEIWDTGDAPGPRDICIGDAPEDVLALFPKEYDYRSDTYSRFYGLPPFDGAGGCAYLGPDGEVLTITLTTDEAEPYLRIEFQEGKAVRLFMGCSWI